MATYSDPSSSFLGRATDPTWQEQLRASVRLYLRLSANPAIEQELDALLQRSEEELLAYLLAGEPPTPAERQRAQHFLDMAQCQLLAELAAERVPTTPSPLTAVPVANEVRPE